MKNFISAVFLLSLFLLNSGCGHTPVRNVFPSALPPDTAEPAVSNARAAEFKKIIAPAEIRGIALYPAAFNGRVENRKVLDVIGLFGFNRIYCRLTSEQELDGSLALFIQEASARNIPVEIVLSQQDFYRHYRGNRLIRNLFIQYPDLLEVVRETVEFNQSLENCRIAGITVILTPHLFDGSNVERTHGSLYRWDEKRYGIGEDNDMLVRNSLEYASEISRIENLPPLTIALPDFLHDAAAAGKLSCGKISDFQKLSTRCAVISSANLPSKIPGMIQQELDAANGQKVLAVVALAPHSTLDQGQLRRRNWTDFRNSMAYLMKKTGNHPAFGGIIVSPLAVIEYLRQEK